MRRKILFVGGYPNVINPYHRAFFKNLIDTIADGGNDCYVISPISITKYRNKTKEIPMEYIDKTSNDTEIHVYHPRFMSYSQKEIFQIKTGIWSENAMENAAIKVADRLVTENKFDFVYGHFFLTGGLAAIKIGKKHNIPAFVAFGECDYETQVRRPYRELTLSDIDGLTGIVSVSTKNTNELKGLGIFNDIPTLTAPNAVDLSKFNILNKNGCREKLGIPTEEFVVGFVGGFIERKGDKRLLEAVNQIDGVYVAFAGAGADRPSGEKVLFCNRLDHDDIPVFLNAIDVFCLPTLSEGSCNAIVEAGACGLPIISSDLEFNDDLLNNDNSIRINPMSVEEIKLGIEKLYNDDALRRKMSAQIFEDVQTFSIEARATKILKFIDGLCM